MLKEEAKKKIKALVEQYDKFKSEGKIRANDEEQIKQHFIEPLFEYLGWDLRNPEEVIKEERVGRKKVDFAFKINDITCFFVEAKAYNVDLLSKEVVEQALNYGWNKGITWTLLTNFERIFILNTEWKITGSLVTNNYKTLYYDRFADDQFDLLWLLSKESFLENKLDEKAEKEERKPKRMPVTSQLFQDMTKVRDILRKDIVNNNKSLVEKSEVVDEIIQRIIDKLIFIRKTEDLGLEDYPLKSAIHLYKSDQLKQLTKKIQEMFIEFDSKYNSEMFKSEHISNTVKISDGVIYKVARVLYSPDERFSYNFAQIDADVLGNIYEQYLGLLLKGGKLRGKFEISKKHKKEQGIYYTPTYIVDYIVKNTIGSWIKEKRKDITKIKVLDPACGSGSFLIRALDFIYNQEIKDDGKEYQSKLEDGKKARTTLKSDIVKHNIFGVDLDEKAVDVAQLNLLLKTAETRQRLPTLRENIKIGNSIIDNPDYTNKPFYWKQNFSFGDGLDVVIGNPPYVQMQKMPRKEREFFVKYRPNEYQSQNDVWYYFLIKGVNILREGGYLGYITSRYFLEATHAKKLRKFIIDNCQIKTIIDFGNINIFEGVGTHTSIIILKKECEPKKRQQNKIKVITTKRWEKDNSSLIQHIVSNSHKDNYEDDFISVFLVEQNKLSENSWELVKKEGLKLIGKIREQSYLLNEVCTIGTGVKTGYDTSFVLSLEEIKKHNIERDLLKKWVKNSEILKWGIRFSNKYVVYLNKKIDLSKHPNTEKYLLKFKSLLKKKYKKRGEDREWYLLYRPREYLFEEPTEKLVCPYKAQTNRFAYDTTEYCGSGDIYAIILKRDSKLNLKYILGLLNSNLLVYYFRKVGKKKGNMYEYYTEPLSKLPIHKIVTKEDKDFEEKIIKLVERLIEIRNELLKQKDIKTDKSEELVNKITKLENELNTLVYNLYELTDSEIKIVEDSLK